MAYHSQSSRNIFASNPTRPLPSNNKPNGYYPSHKRPLPPNKTAPPSPKFKLPQMHFSKSVNTCTSKPKTSLKVNRSSSPNKNRPSSPRKIPKARPISPRKHTPPAHSLPSLNKSRSHPHAPLPKVGFFNSVSTRNIGGKPLPNKKRNTPPTINTHYKYQYNNNNNNNNNHKHIKAQSHSPIRSNPSGANSPGHRLTKSFHIKKLPSQNRRIQNIFGRNNKKNNSKKKNKKKKKKKNKNIEIFDDAHFTEADLGSDDEKNDKIIHWIRGELIGIGAFGKVYKGYDKNAGKKCAIKQIPFNPMLNNDKTNKRKTMIDREAHIMRQLKHENIVEFYGYQTSKKYKTFCILMELVIGISIEEYYHKNGCLNEPLIKRYTRQIMRALSFAHKQNIIHRDIKGKNILISNNVIKICDFGSAKLADTTLGIDKFQPSMDYQYTPLWTAPEVLHNNGYNDKIDIWSVGCVIIEMCTATHPWSECTFDNPFAALYHIGQPDNYPSYPNSLSKLLKDFIKLCLVRDVTKRCSADELLRHKFLDNVTE